jgi:hypothetical protein
MWRIIRPNIFWTQRAVRREKSERGEKNVKSGEKV